VLFNSLEYLLFLPTVVAVYWLAAGRFRPLLLLLASYYFYMSWFAKYGLLLAFLTVVNYSIGLILVHRKINGAQRQAAYLIGLCANLGCLIVFKYTNFLLDSAWRFFSQILSPWFHFDYLHHSAPHLHILLPLGISFFVFEFVHYLTDVYGGSYAIKNPISFGLFAAFFPSQIAGPIKRYEDFDGQLRAIGPFDAKLFQAGCWLIIEGMFKKVVLGDNLAPIVQQGFADPHSLASLDAWLCAICFALQIYYDFSGYTDIGRGSAMLFGFKLPENFNKPYLATSLIDFWHRWHMSLSTWLRDYLYKPLGGGRNGRLRKYRNLLITMLLGGLWHGASWHYVLWGAFHGAGLVINHAWRQLRETRIDGGFFAQPIVAASTSLFTLLFVLLGWVLFRAHSTHEALIIYQAMFHFQREATFGPCLSALLAGALPIGFLLYGLFQGIKYIAQNWSQLPMHHLEKPIRYSLRWWLSPTKAYEVAGYLACCIIILALAAHTANPFIYFQF
jgi:D-alanyl-lipoteichoic acid acyltransferase DltB (MBOAT superfamily)